MKIDMSDMPEGLREVTRLLNQRAIRTENTLKFLIGALSESGALPGNAVKFLMEQADCTRQQAFIEDQVERNWNPAPDEWSGLADGDDRWEHYLECQERDELAWRASRERGSADMGTDTPPARPHPGVQWHYQSGEVITNFHIVQDTDLSHESMADVVVTLAAALDELAAPDRFDYTATARKVAGLWREATRRGVVLH